MSDSLTTVLVLSFLLLALIVLLIFLYKKLNKDADGKYTVRNMVYREGGIRDQVRGAALTVGMHLGVQLWPGGKTEEDGEEMQEIQDEEAQVEDGGSDSDGDDQEEDDSSNRRDERRGKGEDTSDDDSGSEGSNQEEQEEVMDPEQEAKGETGEEKEEKTGDGEGKGEASGGAGLLIDLKQFSGSAIWSEGGGGAVQDGNVTAL